MRPSPEVRVPEDLVKRPRGARSIWADPWSQRYQIAIYLYDEIPAIDRRSADFLTGNAFRSSEPGFIAESIDRAHGFSSENADQSKEGSPFRPQSGSVSGILRNIKKCGTIYGNKTCCIPVYPLSSQTKMPIRSASSKVLGVLRLFFVRLSGLEFHRVTTQICPLPQLAVSVNKHREFRYGEYIMVRFENKKVGGPKSEEITIKYYAI
ncbi:hypothetical protein SELMODRAFT_407011 [Selaginella moellendorffii]|uniref:Uncharacterized protein n=1 Tax=Selaginella moellendorffii TaxID=88036 RepID=D8R3M2_SELML|nr:hypothetical protein SELMODRAFT_407011 [Selaginella moellendorffii]